MYKRKLNKFSKDEVDEIQRYLLNLFPQQESCFIKIFSKKTKEFKFYPVQTLREVGKLQNILNHFEKEDLMISANTFKTMDKATETNLFSINTICVDIDYKKLKWCKDLPPEHIIKLLELDYFGVKLPKPNYIEYSNQLRLIYVLSEPIYIPKKNVAVRGLCQRISEEFATILKDEFGAETQKCEKFIRIPYSINTKTSDDVKIMPYSQFRYTLKELQENWLSELPEWYEKWKEKSQNEDKKPVKPFNALEFNPKRLNDFRKLQNYLNQNDIRDFRSRLCFLFHNYTLMVYSQTPNVEKGYHQKAIYDVLAFNQDFKYPLLEKQIISDTKFLRYRQYKYSNETIMEFLELTNELCEELCLESIFENKSKELVNKEYYTDNKEELLKKQKAYNKANKGKLKEYKQSYYKKNKDNILTKRKQKYKENKATPQTNNSKTLEKELLKQQIKELSNQGFSQKDISDKLSISTRTIRRYLKE